MNPTTMELDRFLTFTDRTNYPKLGWLIHQIEEAGIECQLDGESWHAPILKVRASQLDDAWKILDPVDDIPDDDRRFRGFESRTPDNPDCTPIDECLPYGSNR